MKPKSLIITVACVLLAGILIFFLVKRSNKTEKSDVVYFLNGFNSKLIMRDKKALKVFFDESLRASTVRGVINLLTGGTEMTDKGKPWAQIRLDVEESVITDIKAGLAQATVPVVLSHDSVEQKTSTIILKLRKNKAGKLKIIKADVQAFSSDYVDYVNLVKSKNLKDEDIYSPTTLEAFKVAKQLMTKYDSVAWFDHVGGKTYYYVVKGKFEEPGRGYISKSADYKMGMVGPDQKEIIPAEFSLIHNIGATFDNMIEVEQGEKRGFYNLDGKNVVPVIYDQIYPVAEGENIAIVKKEDDYFWLKNDYSVGEKTEFKLSEILPKLKRTGSFTLETPPAGEIMECNSRQDHSSVLISPSYLVDLNLLPAVQKLKNPLRRNVELEDLSKKYIVTAEPTKSVENGNWLQTTFYNIRDYFLGGRADFYDRKNLVIVDNRHNRILSADIGIDYTPGEGAEILEGNCNIDNIRAINDSLLEVRAGASLCLDLYDSTKTLTAGTYYHYLVIKGNKVEELKNDRVFGFTKYMKMDDSYLNGCYRIMVGDYKKNKTVTIEHLTPEILRVMKNEIFADYSYQFKDKRWQDVFQVMETEKPGYDNDHPKLNANVDDSLTAIDKYNIAWINNKLKTMSGSTTKAK